MSNSERAINARDPRDEVQQPDFIVRAKSGVNRRDWITIGAAWKRQNGEGYSITLKATPMTINNKIVLKLLVPSADEDETKNGDDQ